MLDLIASKESTRGVDSKNVLDTILTNAEVPLNRLVSVATDFRFLCCGSLKLGFYDMRLIQRASLATTDI